MAGGVGGGPGGGGDGDGGGGNGGGGTALLKHTLWKSVDPRAEPECVLR